MLRSRPQARLINRGVLNENDLGKGFRPMRIATVVQVLIK